MRVVNVFRASSVTPAFETDSETRNVLTGQKLRWKSSKHLRYTELYCQRYIVEFKVVSNPNYAVSQNIRLCELLRVDPCNIGT